jgi:hypothetical protein
MDQLSKGQRVSALDAGEPDSEVESPVQKSADSAKSAPAAESTAAGAESTAPGAESTAVSAPGAGAAAVERTPVQLVASQRKPAADPVHRAHCARSRWTWRMRRTPVDVDAHTENMWRRHLVDAAHLHAHRRPHLPRGVQSPRWRVGARSFASSGSS